MTVPGVVALRLRPDLLAELCYERDVLLVSGTNGKTTTTGLLAAALGVSGPVVSNDSGSNLKAGLVTALMLAPAGRTAVLEVDEVVLPVALRSCRPSVVLLLNLSRDQLDRSSEVAVHMRQWSAALADSSAHIVANADDPLVAQVVRHARPDGVGVSWVAAGQPWRGDSAICPSCSAVWDVEIVPWRCPACALTRPEVSWSLVGRRLQHGNLDLPLDLALPGRAAAADAVLAAAAAAASTVPVRVQDAVAAMAALPDVAGRYRVVRRGRQEIRLMLVKNPAGWVEALEEVRGRQTPVLLCFNARPADGTDPSWLWDVPFEQLAGVPVLVTGERATDVAVRLFYAEVAHTVHPSLLLALDALPDGPCTLVANYTAFVAATTLLAGSRS